MRLSRGDCYGIHMLGARRISRSDLCLKCLGTGFDGFIQYRARMKGRSLNEATGTSRPLLKAAGRADRRALCLFLRILSHVLGQDTRTCNCIYI